MLSLTSAEKILVKTRPFLINKINCNCNMDGTNEDIYMNNLCILSKEENTAERRRILKNILIISFGFMLNFTAYLVRALIQFTLMT